MPASWNAIWRCTDGSWLRGPERRPMAKRKTTSHAPDTRGDAGSPPSGEGLPGWLPPVVYAALTLLLFREFVFSNLMLFGSDTLSLGYVAREFYARALAEGSFPLWNPHLLGGVPFLEALSGGDALYPPSLILLGMLEPHRALGWKLVLHVFLAGLFMYGWVRSLGRSRAAAFLAGLGYMMAPVLVTLVSPGHDGKMFVTALTPLAFWMLDGALTRDLRWAGGLAAVIGLILLTTHFQMAYFLFLSMGAYAAYRVNGMGRAGAWGRGGGRFALFLSVALLGAGVGAVQFLPAVDYVVTDSRRTATTTVASVEENLAYSSSWSLHPEELLGFVVPEFVGSNAGEEDGPRWMQNTYWGRNGFKDNHEYFGLLGILLAVLAAGGMRRAGHRGFFLGLGLVALLYTLGRHTPVWRIFYEAVPGISLFRVPSIAAFLVAFSAWTLAAVGIDRLLDADEEDAPRLARRLWIGAAAIGALLVLAGSGALFGFWTGVVYPDMGEIRAQILQTARPSFLRGFFWAALLAVALAGLVQVRERGGLGRAGLVAGLAVLLVVDGGRIAAPFIRTLDVDTWAAPDRSTQFLIERAATEEPFRVLSMRRSGQDVKPALYGLDLAAGHHPNDLARYRTLVGMEGSGQPRNLFTHPQLLRLLNVRYLLWPNASLGPPFEGREPLAADAAPDGRIIQAVYDVPDLPRARLVSEVRVLEDDAAMAHMLSPAFDPAREVVLADAPPTPLAADSVDGRVTWVSRAPNELVLDVESTGPSMLVLAENWTDAWRADVDGTPAPVLRAYHALRAVPVPGGASRVRLWYDTSHLMRGLWLSVASVLGVAGVIGVGWMRARSREAHPEA